jgi:hypothetical protein
VLEASALVGTLPEEARDLANGVDLELDARQLDRVREGGEQLYRRLRRGHLEQLRVDHVNTWGTG